jgi:hypothetical protein
VSAAGESLSARSGKKQPIVTGLQDPDSKRAYETMDAMVAEATKHF